MHKHLHYRILRRRRGQDKDRKLIIIIAENSPSVGRHMDIQICEVRKSHIVSTKEVFTESIIIKLSKVKVQQRFLKAAWEECQDTCKGINIRLLVINWTEILKARREWDDIFKVLKNKNMCVKNSIATKPVPQK